MKETLAIKKEDALGLFDGNQAALARALGVTRQAINKVPDEGSLSERLTSRLRLRKPDAFDRRGNLRNPTANHKTS